MGREHPYVVTFAGAGLTKGLETRPGQVPLMEGFLSVMADHLEDPTIQGQLAGLEVAQLFSVRHARLQEIAWLLKEDEGEIEPLLPEWRELIRRERQENIETILGRLRGRRIQGGSFFNYITVQELRENQETRRRFLHYMSLLEAAIGFNFAINRMFNRIGWDLRLDLLRRFLRQQLGEDARRTFVCFNYDLTLDLCLQLESAGSWQPATGYGFPMTYRIEAPGPGVESNPDRGYELVELEGGVPGRIELLKPHGSLNWLVPFEGSYEYGDGPVATFLDREGLVKHCPFFSTPSLPHPDGGLRNWALFLLPPIAGKHSSLEFIRKTKALEAEALAQADEVVVIGWSLPMSDEDQRGLIAEAIARRDRPLQKVTVVNYRAPSSYYEQITRILGVGRERVEVHDDGFESFVEALGSS